LIEVSVMIGLVNVAFFLQRRVFRNGVAAVPAALALAAEEACPPPVVERPLRSK